MCFSANASFTTSALLSVIGIASIKLSTTKQDKLLAYTPLIFAFQQFCEGVLWLTLPDQQPYGAYIFGMYGFLFFTLLFWPVWIPYVTTLTEQNSLRKKILMNFVYIGMVTCMLFLWFVPTSTVSAQAVGKQIVYTINLPKSTFIQTSMMLLYLLVIVPPLFISTIPYLWVIGLLLSGSYAISYFFYRYALISVWCFFAAVISSVVLVLVSRKKQFRKS
jgi:hypothetical protein